MKTDKMKNGNGLFSKIRARLFGDETDKVPAAATAGDADDSTANENLRIIEEYEAVKEEPTGITGWDFDRAFDFLEKHPDSDYSRKLKDEMYGTNSSTLKGLSYQSAVKILQRMPDHPGAESIFKGMGSIESSYIKELKSDVIAYIIEILPDHPLREELATALAVKNLTNAYDFVERNPEHPCTRLVIGAMFDRDPNIATLLLHERMDHPQVGAIIQGLYSIDRASVSKLMPDAILFILEVAADHPYAEELMAAMIDKNHIKAFEFLLDNPEHPLAEKAIALLGKKKPELAALLNSKI